jgi:predicted dithiol-disulfide oxidoreductase (DUF899 family)
MAAQDTLHDARFPGETDDYRSARDELLRAELELRDQIEAVAEQRRRLPLGGEVSSDYTFQEWDAAAGAPSPVGLSELFEDGKDTLFLYSFMFVADADGKPLSSACPSCTSILDAVSGQVRHLTQQINFAVAAKVPIEQFRAHAAARGWPEVRLLSSAGTSYNHDYHAESPDGSQLPMANVFVRRGGGIHHFWSSELRLVPAKPGQDHRHVDFMWPLWSILDRTPAGRGADWHPRLKYG